MKKILFAALLCLALIAACTPASTPTAVPPPDDSAITTAVVTVDMFYTFVNEAQSPEELGLPWNMLTLDEQCNPRDKCELTNFQTTWWESKALYRLYSCTPTSVISEEMRYARTSARPSALTDPDYWAFELVDSDGFMLIGKRYIVQSPGEECALALDRVANP